MPTPVNKPLKIILGVTGGIAAYKIPMLLRLLKKADADVQVIMTPSAERFVTPETLSVLSEKQVLCDFFDPATGMWNNHVDLGLWADAILIAPATATTIGKMVHGIADNLLLATHLSARCPVIIAPAMDLDMYAHESVTENLKTLESRGVHIIPAEDGPLASGLSGPGRLPEPETLFAEFMKIMNPELPLKGKNIMVSAGPTFEPIDPVRFIGNHSSGKMGYAIADAFAKKGANVTLVSGPVSLQTPKNVSRIDVQTAEEMREACLKESTNVDIIVMAAAVADYKVETRAQLKIKKEEDLTLSLVKNPDILQELGKAKTSSQTLIGFALETNNGYDYAKDKVVRKNLDFIVLNSLADEGAGFGHDTNKVYLFDKTGSEKAYPLMSKKMVADIIVKQAISYHFSGNFADI
ncbi:MAG: bifunctional phosphopantothenoylcysteine decarboxylase/phosphopantothenate--cysteine ligase CoaBC [Sphingomonadales bacterium]|nr:bifunctional phosphopantothenoylcysteine decarboxylase/phosphopantothenate--cysteine ligase CoaBC [Sphingomonadales bacterium]